MKSLIAIIVGLVVLSATAVGRADIAWTAPSPTYVSGTSATNVDYIVSVASTSTDLVNNYNVYVLLTPINVAQGSIQFGTAFAATDNYLFQGLSTGGYLPSSLSSDTIAAGSDYLSDTRLNATLTGSANLLDIPVEIAPYTSGTWQVSFVDDNDCAMFNAAGGQVNNYAESAGTVTVTTPLPEPATWALLASAAGLGLIRWWRRGRLISRAASTGCLSSPGPS